MKLFLLFSIVTAVMLQGALAMYLPDEVRLFETETRQDASDVAFTNLLAHLSKWRSIGAFKRCHLRCKQY